MKIGVIISTAGSAFISAWEIIQKTYPDQVQFFVLTDRDCYVEVFCKKQGISCHQIKYSNRTKFSLDAANYFNSLGKIDAIILYYSKLIGDDLFKNFLCFNIHPALLPSFKGIDGVDQFLDSGSRFLGATLHLVDEGIDTGKIIVQVSTPVENKITREKANKISYLQKVHITLIGFYLLKNNFLLLNSDHSNYEWSRQLPYTHSANPCLDDEKLLANFNELEVKENTRIL
jgi:phosphoribosylglycinamide formyltransferase-1